MTTAADTKLTREESAYLYLASFAKGAYVIVRDSLGRRSGTVTIPQRGNLTDAYLTVRMDGSGDEIWVELADLLSGRFTITSAGATQNTED
jgi:hypothetical protein